MLAQAGKPPVTFLVPKPQAVKQGKTMISATAPGLRTLKTSPLNNFFPDMHAQIHPGGVGAKDKVRGKLTEKWGQKPLFERQPSLFGHLN